MSKLLITGASGLLGSNLLFTALNQYEVFAIYNQHGLRSNQILSLQLDLTDKRSVTSVIHDLKPNWIVHCAALTNVDYCETHPDIAWSINVEATQHLASVTRAIGSRLVYISTDSVFDGQKGRYSENDLPNPINAYAKSKLAGEYAVLELVDKPLIIRTNIYGWNMQENLSFAEWILNQLQHSNTIKGFQDVYFTPILVNELSNIILQMMEAELSGIYHVAGSQRISKYQFAYMLADIFELDCSLVQSSSITQAHLIAPRPLDTSLDTLKISNTLKMIMPDIATGLNRFKTLHDEGYITRLKALQV